LVEPATKKSRNVARERLSVILASQRGSELLEGVDMKLLQADVLDVVQRHVNVAKDRPINFEVRTQDELNFIEMTLELSQSQKPKRADSIKKAQS